MICTIIEQQSCFDLLQTVSFIGESHKLKCHWCWGSYDVLIMGIKLKEITCTSILVQGGTDHRHPPQIQLRLYFSYTAIPSDILPTHQGYLQQPQSFLRHVIRHLEVTYHCKYYFSHTSGRLYLFYNLQINAAEGRDRQLYNHNLG